uniref:Uncharacterized protein n=1 Tax=Panagrolaimus davidi TaxID=227884 RepID=A0A914P8A4_9BILA
MSNSVASEGPLPGNDETVSSPSASAVVHSPTSASTSPTTAGPPNIPASPPPTTSPPPTISPPPNTAAQRPTFGDFHFTTAHTYSEWGRLNGVTVLDCWAACIPNKNIQFSSVVLYNYFCNVHQKTVIVLCGHLMEEKLGGRSNPMLMQEAESRLAKTLADLLRTIDPRYEIFTGSINTFLTAMHRWLNFPIFLEWAHLSSKSPLHIMIKRRRNYYGVGGRELTIPAFTADDQISLDQLATALRETATTTEIEMQLKNTLHLRKSWTKKLIADPELERGVATAFFQKFPIFTTKLELVRSFFYYNNYNKNHG